MGADYAGAAPVRDPVGHFSASVCLPAWHLCLPAWHLRLPLAPLLSALGRVR